MKERPILFSAPMVRPVLADTKTQTRRAIKGQQFWGEHIVSVRKLHPGVFRMEGAESIREAIHSNPVTFVDVRCPYGVPGDRLWVRETFFAFGRWETRFSAAKGRDEWHFVDMTLECGRQYIRAADAKTVLTYGGRGSAGSTPMWWKRPAIFMPRAASRLTLEVTEVRVERLQVISRGDAMDEGCPFPNMAQGDDPRKWYAELWDEINGAGAWAANPWVWAVTFKRVKS